MEAAADPLARFAMSEFVGGHANIAQLAGDRRQWPHGSSTRQERVLHL